MPFLELYADYPIENERKAPLHAEELAYRFHDLLLRHYKENKGVEFYAGKLCISPQYLSGMLTMSTGKSPKGWIVHYTLQEIYALLENPSVSIQDIARITKFANSTTLRRFLKKHTNISIPQNR